MQAESQQAAYCVGIRGRGAGVLYKGRAARAVQVGDHYCGLDDLVLPYIFEFPVYLPDRGWVFPDFTILNVRLRKAYLWEHLGRMDDPGYLVSNISKLKSYEKEGYYMGDNLIVTFETKDSPIDTRQVDRLIKHFLM